MGTSPGVSLRSTPGYLLGPLRGHGVSGVGGTPDDRGALGDIRGIGGPGDANRGECPAVAHTEVRFAGMTTPRTLCPWCSRSVAGHARHRYFELSSPVLVIVATQFSGRVELFGRLDGLVGGFVVPHGKTAGTPYSRMGFDSPFVLVRLSHAFWHHLRGAGVFGDVTGGVAALNPRLPSGTPPGSRCVRRGGGYRRHRQQSPAGG